jgi:hypothetical protein
MKLLLFLSRPTVCVIRAGVDSVWEQEKLEGRKMPENAPCREAVVSSARVVGWLFVLQYSPCC